MLHPAGTWGSAIAVALRSPLGVGGAGFRVLRDTETEVDTGFAGVLRASTLRALGGWDEDWPVNQDAELAARVRAANGRIVCLPEMLASGSAARQPGRACEAVLALRPVPGEDCAPAPAQPPSLTSAAARAPRCPRARGGGTCPAPLARAGGRERVRGCPRCRDGEAHPRRPRPAARVPAALAIMHLSWGAGFVAGSVRFGPPVRAVGNSARTALQRLAGS